MDNTVRIKLTGGGIRYVESFTESAPPNSEFEAHVHPSEVEILMIEDGDLFFSFEGKRIEVERGTVIVITNDSYHRPIIKSTCRYKRAHVFISTKTLMSFDVQNVELFKRISQRRILILSPDRARELGSAQFLRRVKECLLQDTPYGEFCATVAVVSFLIGAEEMTAGPEYTAFYTYSDTVTKIIEYIAMDLTADLSYRSIAKELHLSEKYLYKLFKREVGMTLSGYVLERRIVKAQTVLNAGGSAKEASESAGFGDYSVFYRAFLRETGMTPSEYVVQRQ